MTVLDKIENNRKKASYDIEVSKQKLFEQYFTPNDISEYMSGLFSDTNKDIKILDAGAGVGNLGAVVSLKYLNSKTTKNIYLTSIEWDRNLIKYINENLMSISTLFKEFSFKVRNENFYTMAKKLLNKGIKFNRIIINPPYSITSKNTTEEIAVLKELNVKTPNSYSNFIELCYRLLTDDGELVAIVPRSFCNGTRYTKFRTKMLKSVKIEFIHSFESRKEVFKEYGIFQEIVIIKLTKKLIRKTTICISDKLDDKNCEKFNFDKITFKHDPYKFIHHHL
jgi:adenine-specific DNA-methyltransferase